MTSFTTKALRNTGNIVYMGSCRFLGINSLSIPYKHLGPHGHTLLGVSLGAGGRP